MYPAGIAFAQFVAKTSSAGIVNVELGFVPDFVILLSDIDGTSPNMWMWANAANFSVWTTALSLLTTGTTGVVTRDTTGITVYAGGDKITSAETTDTAGKHVNRSGTAAPAGRLTLAGITIPADHQVAGGKHLLMAFRGDPGKP